MVVPQKLGRFFALHLEPVYHFKTPPLNVTTEKNSHSHLQ